MPSFTETLPLSMIFPRDFPCSAFRAALMDAVKKYCTARTEMPPYRSNDVAIITTLITNAQLDNLALSKALHSHLAIMLTGFCLFRLECLRIPIENSLLKKLISSVLSTYSIGILQQEEILYLQRRVNTASHQTIEALTQETQHQKETIRTQQLKISRYQQREANVKVEAIKLKQENESLSNALEESLKRNILLESDMREVKEKVTQQDSLIKDMQNMLRTLQTQIKSNSPQVTKGNKSMKLF